MTTPPLVPGQDDPTNTPCPFCSLNHGRLVHEGTHVRAIWDKMPVTPGHALVATKRHVASWFEASREEQVELMSVLDLVRDAVLKEHAPKGFNIGINDGVVAGQTVPHLHVHLIPRYEGDVPDPRGGVRWVVPDKANYLRDGLGGASIVAESDDWGAGVHVPVPHRRTIIAGGDDPLEKHLKPLLADTDRADIAVAFITQSGLNVLEPHFRDLLARKGRIRLLTGDYLGFTDPDCLNRLLDLKDEYPEFVTLRVYECRGDTFHPKVYILNGGQSGGVAVVGSSNMTKAALSQGAVEWNQRTIHDRDVRAFQDVSEGFEELFRHRQTSVLTSSWIESYRARRKPMVKAPSTDDPRGPEETLDAVSPHPVQQEALEALAATRKAGNEAGLVVLATGLGKTWLSAFDAEQAGAKRVLFVAHREEILNQARQTFRRIRPQATLGLYTGKEKVPEADVIFASIQTMGRVGHLAKFPPTTFDYIIIDEFHHAAASNYKKLLLHFRPAFMLGLTATPERTDGGDLLGLCGENLVFNCDLVEGIRQGLLAPYRYFGIPDKVDYSNIPWRSSRFDPEELTNKLASDERAENSLEQYREKAGDRTLAFCCSVRHAVYMRDYFANAGIACAVVHSQAGSDGRASSLERLTEGTIQVLFTVDMFNEGVDLPLVDTVLMLRPTESKILWIQQFGRGLRKAEGKDHLRVIDYIGNHRSFLNRPQILLGLPSGDSHIRRALKELEAGDFTLPEGCEITYDLEAVDIMKALLRTPGSTEALKAYYEDHRERFGERPTASQAYHEGYHPRKVRGSHGDWVGFVESMEELGSDELHLLASSSVREFLHELETMSLTKSFKAVVLLAALNQNSLPGSIQVVDLADEVRRIVMRSEILRKDFDQDTRPPRDVEKVLVDWPIKHLVKGRSPTERSFFRYVDRVFSVDVQVPSNERAILQEWARELLDLRLAEYLDRDHAEQASIQPINLKVVIKDSEPVLHFVTTIKKQYSIPSGPTEALVNDAFLSVDFGKTGIDAVHELGGGPNLLPRTLREWFGAEAGLPGTRNTIRFYTNEEGVPVLGRLTDVLKSDGPVLWQEYMREAIPPLFGLKFTKGGWNQGFIRAEEQVFLLVTLEKSGMSSDHNYSDHFIDTTTFEWVSQNQHKQDSTAGKTMRDHSKLNVPIHLFIRQDKKRGSRAAPFIYCGEVEFISWKGETPITIRWKLPSEVPATTWKRLHP